jgi:hypothetical protein
MEAAWPSEHWYHPTPLRGVITQRTTTCIWAFHCEVGTNSERIFDTGDYCRQSDDLEQRKNI